MTSAPTLPLGEPVASREMVDLVPLVRHGRNWTAWFGPVLSLLLLGAVFYQVGSLDLRSLWALVPRTPLFWATFALTYSLTPLFDWVIFRRLWRIPAGGLAALFRKRLSNELLLGYVGDVYFYAWARRNVTMTGSPFGAVKDSALLSGMMGNIATLVMIGVTFPMLPALHLALSPRVLALSLSILVLTSIVPMLFRRRLFSLPGRDQRATAAIHLARIVVNLLLYAALWHMMLPDVTSDWWVLLSTVRLALSRLPLVPNKDALFAGVAALLIGPGSHIDEVFALLASLLLAAHLLVGLVLGITGMLRERSGR